MSKSTVRRINKVASLLEKGARGIVNSLELVIRDAAPKRVKRARR